MSIQYKVVKKAQAGVKGGGEFKYHAAATGRKVMRTPELSRELSQRCTAKAGDVKLVLTELAELLPELLRKGISVQVEEIGIFSATLVSQLKETPEEVTNSSVKGVRIQFRADKRLKKQMKNCSFKKAKS